MSEHTLSKAQQREINFVEFVLIMALCTSLVALSIDSMLPALDEISTVFKIVDINQQQFMIGMLFIGLSIGQLFAGPISDSIGRKNTVYAGLSVFIAGSFISYFSTDYSVMLLGRFIQGFGAAAPRIISMAMVRDKYAGRDMARVMSYIMGVFILVPAVAPAFGQAVMMLTGGWRPIFLFFALIALILFVLFARRIDETLKEDDRRKFDFATIWRGLKRVCSNRQTLLCAIGAGCNFGSFLAYISTSQQIFQGYFDTGALFPLYFGLTALAIGVAFFVNARLVKRLGMRYVIARSLIVIAALSLLFLIYELSVGHNGVSLAIFVTYMMSLSFCMGMIFGNFNALALEPMGHIAGMASSVVGFVSLFVAVAVGMGIGHFYNGTLLPLTFGFLVLSLITFGLVKAIK